MAEQFHQWVNNMPWYEKLYYQLFDPQAITCSTSTIPFNFSGFFLSVAVIAIVGAVVIIWLTKREANKVFEELALSNTDKSEVK